jgi:hypothetical protein
MDLNAEIRASVVVLGKTIYRVRNETRHGLDLMGPRGGVCHLVQTTNQPTVYALNKIGKLAGAYYRRNADGTFTKI